MANHFPDVPAGTHVGSVSYVLSVSPLSSASGRESTSISVVVPLGSPTSGVQVFTTGFDGSIADGVIAYDQSGFDQDVYEASLVTFLDAWCAYTAAVLGVTLEQAQAAVKVQRAWYVELDDQVLGATTMYTNVYDTMTYPPAA